MNGISKHTPGPWHGEKSLGHTPGPWTTHYWPSLGYMVRAKVATKFGESCADIAIVQPKQEWVSTDEAKANLRLIAAAPDLLAFAGLVLGECEGQHADPEAVLRALAGQARAALAKATGEQS